MLSKILDGSLSIETVLKLSDNQIGEQLDIPWK